MDDIAITVDGTDMHVRERGATATVAAAGGVRALLQGSLIDPAPDGEDPAERLLHGYLDDGRDVFGRLRGRWAAVVHDGDATVAAVDRFARIPVYYRVDGGRFHATTDVPALLAAREGPVQVDPGPLTDFLRHGLTDHRPATCIAGVNRLMPGTSVRYADGTVTVEPYSGPRARGSGDLRDLVRERVERRCIADGTAVAVSGGVDSSTVAGLHPGARLVTAIYPGKSFDEREHSHAVARTLDADIDAVPVTGGDVLDEVGRTVQVQGRPTTTVQAQVHHLLCRRFDDVDVLHLGSGPDEYGCGYPSLLTRHIADLVRRGRWRRAARLVRGYRDDIAPRFLLATVLPGAMGRMLQRSPRADRYVSPPAGYDAPATARPPDSLRDGVERRLYRAGLPASLRVAHHNARANGTEIRTPLLDEDVVDRALALDLATQFDPPRYKARFRDAVDPFLPGPARDRDDKVGFAHNTDEWYDDREVAERFMTVFGSDRFRGRDHVDADAVGRSLRRDRLPFYLAHRFYVYEHWMREFVDPST